VIIEGFGNARTIFAAERLVLNLMQHLSGVSTATRKYVEALQGTKAKILDTRKTIPGLRELQKYAVKTGGANNHRMALYDGILIKDNHIAAAGGVVAAFAKVRSTYPEAEIEIEVDTFEQLIEVLPLSPDLILLDNMSPEECAKAVALVNGKCKLEASGGISISNARAYAQSGVDYIAIGALTHSAPVFDIGLDLRAE
jgi:nicotinate-nucleotide pyrophosphorylase (carboxylating)